MRRPLILLVFLIVGSLMKIASDSFVTHSKEKRELVTLAAAGMGGSDIPIDTINGQVGKMESLGGKKGSSKRIGFAFVLLSTIVFVVLYTRKRVETKFQDEEVG